VVCVCVVWGGVYLVMAVLSHCDYVQKDKMRLIQTSAHKVPL